MNKEKFDTALVGDSFQATFRKTVNLKSATLFMRIRRLEKREDIQRFLKAWESEEQLFQGSMASVINKRVARYLKEFGLLDASGNLTNEGKTVAQTGWFSAQEEGLFNIWFCRDDELLGNRILYFERQNAFVGSKQRTKFEELPFSFDEAHYCLTDQKDGQSLVFSIEQLGNPNTEQTLLVESKADGKVALLWEWKGPADSVSVLRVENGRVVNHAKEKNKDEEVKFAPQFIKLEELDKNYWLERLFDRYWNSRTNRLRVEFDSLGDSEKSSFIKTYFFDGKYGFDEIRFDRVPLEPLNTAEAEKWRNWLAERRLEKAYMGKASLKDALNELNRKPGFDSFTLEIPDAKSFLKTHFESRRAKARGKAYWHLAAPQDLQPNLSPEV